jgi:hypothetical protein
MSQLIRRAYNRTIYKAPIQYTVIDAKKYHNTRMFNFSPGGLCYETEQELEPESSVCIVMQNYSPDRFGPEAFRSYIARIRWIRPISQNGSTRYATGVQFVARSHEILDAQAQGARHVCDLCGVLMPIAHIVKIDQGCQVCKPCNRHICNIPPGKIRECVVRFLIGNVY